MEILIVARYFSPDNHIAAVRPSMFAKYLAASGNKITVLCSKPERDSGIEIDANNIKVIRIKRGYILEILGRSIRKNRVNKSIDGKVKRFEKLRGEKVTFFKLISSAKWCRGHSFYLLNEIDWYWQARRVLEKKTYLRKFDIVFSTFPPLGPLLLGRFLKRKVGNLCWISDMRDHILDDLYPGFANHWYRIFIRKIYHHSDAVTVVSEGQRRSLESDIGKNRSPKKIKVITNGYNSTNSYSAIDNRILDICYIGNLYGGYRDLSMLFESIAYLIEKGEIERDKVKFHYAGEQISVVQEQMEKYNLNGILSDHGYLSRSRSLELQKKSDLLVVLSWNTKTEKGVMPGKFYEYLDSRKPIISICSGDVPNSEISDRVRSYSLGIDCEYKRVEEDLPRLNTFLKRVYENALSGDLAPWDYDTGKVERHEYKNLAIEIESLMGSLHRKS